jgi:hypothetical protein
MDAAEYCREIEAYLCRKNEGHLIRIVGPAFEQVCGWRSRGVPLKVAFRGIDQYCDRYYAKGPRRRPVRIEFCEADILDLFDGWRRAVGVTAAAADSSEPEPSHRKPALAAHIERVVARLTASRAGSRWSRAFDQSISRAVSELDGLGTGARTARGAARERIIERLLEIDREIVEASACEIDESTAAALRQEAESELAAFGERMAPEARARSITAAFERLVRESLGLAVVAYE